MKLTTFERLTLLNILPAEGDIATMRILRDLRGELSFTEEELATTGLHVEDGQALWDATADEPKVVNVGAVASNIISSALLDLDKQKKIREEHLPLFDKFVHDKIENTDININDTERR